MNYLRKLIYSSAITTVLISGCNTNQLKELNVNPQAAPTIDVNFLFTSAQLGSASGSSPVTGDNRYIDWRTNIGVASTTIQQFAADGGISNVGDKYLENVESYTAPWDFIYRNLNYLGEILRQTGPGGFAEGQNNNTRQAARILKAFLFHRLTDYYGRIPYFEALQAPEGTFFPHYDKQKDVYLDLIKELDEAATALTTDDDPDFAASLEPILTQHGYRVALASTGEEALAKASVDGVDCLVLDLSMPLLTGIDVYRKLKAAGKELPTIFVTGLPGERINAVSELHSDSGVLMKPFDPSDLLRAIASATATVVGKNAA